eukprot:366289-Chlamydomonas_euryale.AAC.11
MTSSTPANTPHAALAARNAGQVVPERKGRGVAVHAVGARLPSVRAGSTGKGGRGKKRKGERGEMRKCGNVEMWKGESGKWKAE